MGLAVTAFYLVQAFKAVSAAPSEKAAMMAQAISHAMRVTAVFVPVSVVLLVASIVVFTVGTFKQPRA